MNVPVLITLDAIGTLIQIKGGIGHQYLTALQQFLASQRPGADGDGGDGGRGWLEGVRRLRRIKGEDHAFPRVTEDAKLMETAAREAIRVELAKDRAAWAVEQSGEANEKEMPIGGLVEESVYNFWRRVLQRAYRDPRIWSFPRRPHEVGVAEKGEEREWTSREAPGQPQLQPHTSLLDAVAPADAWEVMYRHVINDVFGTGEAYEWLPEGKETLVSLNDRRQAPLLMGRVSPPPLVRLVSAPLVLTNSDRRMTKVLTDLGATVEPIADGPTVFPIGAAALNGVVTAMDVGRAKPSSRGLVKCMTMTGLLTGPPAPVGRLETKVIHIHVGDSEEDRLACESAPHRCTYLRCDPKVGVRLADVLDTIVREKERA